MSQFIKPTKGLVTSFFSKNRKHPVLQGVIRPHQGVDFGTHGVDDNVVAAASGTVRVHPYHASGAGNYISINHGNGWTTGYLHLKSVSVKTGQRVSQGQVIGIKGNTGVGTGVHLHFELQRSNGWTNDFNKKVDPLLYIIDPTTKQWQGWLKDLGYYKGAVDGIYGDNTIKAVTEYQQKNKLQVDGVCGRTTYNNIKNKHQEWEKEKGGLTVQQYNELKKLIAEQQKEIDRLKKGNESQEPSKGLAEEWQFGVDHQLTDGRNPHQPTARQHAMAFLARYDKRALTITPTAKKDVQKLFDYLYVQGKFTVHHKVDEKSNVEILSLLISATKRLHMD